jgi:menaquinone-dependent protoporphyrinogen oxidase
MPVALFQLSLYSAVPRHATTARRHLRNLEDTTGLSPDVVGMFGGRLAYTAYGWWTKRLLQLIAFGMRLSTDTAQDADYTDWQAVERFALDFHDVVERKRPRES